MKFNVFALIRCSMTAFLVSELMTICEFEFSTQIIAMVALGGVWGLFDPCLIPDESKKDDTQN